MTIVSFPNLFGGFEISVKRIAFSIFGLDVYWYGLIIEKRKKTWTERG